MRTLYLSNKGCIGIFVYYSILFITSVSLVIIYFYQVEINDSDVYIYATLSGLFGTCIYYIRKLYKDCFLDDKISTDKQFLKQSATMIYFVTRPFFAVAFSFIVVIALKAGFKIVATPQSDLNPLNFIYACIFISFFCGFRVGTLITKFENFEITK